MMKDGDIVEPNWVTLVELGWQYKNEPARLVRYFVGLADEHPSSGRAKFELANVLDYGQFVAECRAIGGSSVAFTGGGKALSTHAFH